MQYQDKMLENARQLRHNMTPWERKLWYCFLRGCPLKIYKQKPIGKYIADFCCPSVKLIIELDGGGHYNDEQHSYDTYRTEMLEKFGYQVVRICNTDIDQNFDGVCSYLMRLLKIG